MVFTIIPKLNLRWTNQLNEFAEKLRKVDFFKLMDYLEMGYNEDLKAKGEFLKSPNQITFEHMMFSKRYMQTISDEKTIREITVGYMENFPGYEIIKSHFGKYTDDEIDDLIDSLVETSNVIFRYVGKMQMEPAEVSKLFEVNSKIVQVKNMYAEELASRKNNFPVDKKQRIN